mgnify:FL=1
MTDNATSVRVQSYTKELINKHSKRLGLSQGDLIEKAISVAEKLNFEYHLPLEEIKKTQVSEANRLIGFLKTQDKNLRQTEENIYHFFRKNLHEDRRAILEYFYFKSKKQMREMAMKYYEEKGGENSEKVAQLFMDRFNIFFDDNYRILLREHHEELKPREDWEEQFKKANLE